jgi:hypothetical protein
LAANFELSAGESSVASADLAALDDFAAANGLFANVPEPRAAAIFLALGLVATAKRRSLAAFTPCSIS